MRSIFLYLSMFFVLLGIDSSAANLRPQDVDRMLIALDRCFIPDSDALEQIEGLGGHIKAVQEYVAFMRAGNMDLFGHRRNRLEEALCEELRKAHCEDSRVYRMMLCNRASYLVMVFQSNRADSVMHEAIRLNEVYETDSIVKLGYRLWAATLNPYETYDAVYGMYEGANLTKSIHEFLRKNETLDDKSLLANLLMYCLYSSSNYGVYSDRMDSYRDRLKTIARSWYPSGSDLDRYIDVHYLIQKFYWSQSTEVADYPDYASLNKAIDLLDSVPSPLEKIAMGEILSSFCINHDRAFSSELIRRDADRSYQQIIDTISSGPLHFMEVRHAINNIYDQLGASKRDNALAILDDIETRVKSRGGDSKAIMEIYNLLFESDVEFAVNVIDRYLKCIEEVDDSEVKIQALANIAVRCAYRGQLARAYECIERANSLLTELSDKKHYRALIDRAAAEVYAGLNNDMSLDYLIRSASEYENLDKDNTEKLLDIYYKITLALYNKGDLNSVDVVRAYIEKFNKIAAKSVWAEWSWYVPQMRLFDIMINYSGDRQLKLIEREKATFFNKRDFDNMATACLYLTTIYFNKEDIEKVEENYHDAIFCSQQTMDYSVMQQAAQGLVNLYFLTGNLKARREFVHAYIDDVENGVIPNNMLVLSFLGKAMDGEVSNGNAIEARYIFEKLNILQKKIMDEAGNDGETVASIKTELCSYMSGFLQSFVDGGSQEALYAMTAMVADLENTMSLVEKMYGRDQRYLNLWITHARCRIILKHDYRDVLKEIDEIQRFMNDNDVNYYWKTVVQTLYLFATIKYDDADIIDMDRLDLLLSMPSEIKQIANLNVSTFSNALAALYLLYAKRGDYDKCEELVKQRYALMRNYIEEKYGSLSEDERIGLSANSVASPIDINTLLQVNNTMSLRSLAYDASLFYKNLLLESGRKIRAMVYASNDTVVIGNYNRLQVERERLSRHVINDEVSRLEFIKIKELCRSLEDSIFAYCESIGEVRISRKATWRDVAKKLKKDEVAVEFIVTGQKYGALIIRKGFSAPEYVELLSFDELDEMIGTGNMSARDVRRLYCHSGRLKKNNKGDLLYQKLWQPLEKYIKVGDVVYYCPVGSLNSIQFAAIQNMTKTPLCQLYSLRLVSTTAQILDDDYDRNIFDLIKRAEGEKINVGIIGGVEYDADSKKSEVAMRNWKRLPNSLVEKEIVDSICSHSALMNVSVIKDGSGASEQWFGSLSGSSPDIILISTHGFFLTGKNASRNAYYINKGLTSDTVPNELIPPLLRGGIILADANPVWNNEISRTDDCDGVLTGAEISQMNLDNTDLVVLSACETGLGDPTATEGVNGLQRAFKMGGVNSVVMSLWEVNDLAGQKFMKEFFMLVANGIEKHLAFSLAQTKLYKEYPDDPFMWAPFVLLD